MRWEKRIIDALEILNNIEALKIKLADGTARAKPMAVVYLLLEYPNSIRDNKQRKNTLLGKYTDDGTMKAYPLYILCLSLMHPSVRFR